MTKIYHYTKGYNIRNIIADGEILVEGRAGRYDSRCFKPNTTFGIAPHVWFTTETEMPFTATPFLRNELGEMPFLRFQMQNDRGYEHWIGHANGVYRLAFDAQEIGAQRYWYGEVRKQLGANGNRTAFEKIARKGNDDVRCWYHCDKPVSLDFLQSFETWRDGEWRPITVLEIALICL